MKTIFTWAFVLLAALSLTNCDSLDEISKVALGGSSSTALTNGDVVTGLKQALKQGTTNGVNVLSAKDGFFKNPSVKILFPPEAQKVEKTLRDIGAGQVVDVAIEKLNRAAEDAAVGAKDIFVNAITSMTINDAMNILMGADDACTQYLKRTTSTQLYNSFNPVISRSLNQVGASNAWSSAITKYNQVPFVQKVNPDLDDHVTNKAMDGLFLMIKKEEKLIRENPVKRVTDIMKRVFAKQDNR